MKDWSTVLGNLLAFTVIIALICLIGGVGFGLALRVFRMIAGV